MRTFSLVFLFPWLVLQIFLPVISPIPSSSAAYAQPVSPVKAEQGQRSRQEAIPSGDPDTSLALAREKAGAGNYKEALAILFPFTPLEKADGGLKPPSAPLEISRHDTPFLTGSAQTVRERSSLTGFTSEPMKHPTIFSDYIVILVWDGRLDEAISIYETLPPSFPRRAYLLRNMAKAYYDQKNFSKAVSLYHGALEQTPRDEEAQKGLLLSHIQMRNFQKASDYLEGFLEKTPDSLPLAFIKARLLIMQGRYLEGLKVCRLLSTREDVESEQVYKLREDLIASLPIEERKRMTGDLSVAVQQGDEQAKLDYILVLTLNKDYKKAMEAFEAANIDLDRYSDYLLSWIAWAYFKTGETEKARRFYERILAARPDYVRAEIGLAYCLTAEGQGDKAIEIMDRLLLVDPQNVEIRFARAFVHEKAGRFWAAIQEYDRIFELSPKNPAARRLRLRAWADLGARSYALEEACKDLPDDPELHDGIKGDLAADLLRWGEPGKAIDLLLPLTKNRENLRARFDYITALTENIRMEEAVEGCENLVKEGVSLPPWVLEAVAEAYLYLEKPREALYRYNEALRIRPDSFNGRLGKFYALQEIREWDEAGKMLHDLDQETPEVLGKGKNARPNWPKLEIALARGWFLAYENRLNEAEEFLGDLYEKAPANIGIRNGLAHVHLWRGWPRQALREFKIIDTLDPQYVKAQPGKIAALNELAFRQEAREEAKSLLASHPRDKDLQELARRLEVEEMRELVVNIGAAREEGGYEQLMAEMTLSQPLSLYTRLYGLLLWQESREDAQAAYFRRAGLGISHTVNSSWDLKQQFSVNYDDGDDFGSLTQVNFYPDDYWRFGLVYDSFVTDVPMRARIYEIEADKWDLTATYRESEWRSYHLYLSHFGFSDDNKRDSALVRYEQGLWAKNNWNMRIFVDLYASRNSRDDAPYFNPDHDLSFSAIHMTEHTLWRIYNRAFVHRLFLTLGAYKQSGFSNELTGAIRYEQDYDFSDTHGLLWGVSLARNAYDGDPVNSYNFYLTYRWRF